jgi:ABC-type multidrug transport system ATPase subunit
VDGRQILEDISGTASEGRLLAIMGPSGAGKTSLLHVLGGMLEKRGGQVLQGRLFGRMASSSPDHTSAFVGQNDNFHAHLSVEETLMLAASLRLPGSTRAERRDAVDATLRQLHLTHARHTHVGNDRTRGISGGERRRLALGCELLGNPRVIFADEPTSGLDAFQAERMMSVLRDLSAQGRTVIVTIHQPSSKVWRMLDDVMLLSGGRTVYFGQRLACLPVLSALGHKCPPETNPAEFVLEVISVDLSSPKREKGTSLRVQALVHEWARRSRSPSSSSSPSSPADSCCGFRGLFSRSAATASKGVGPPLYPPESVSSSREGWDDRDKGKGAVGAGAGAQVGGGRRWCHERFRAVGKLIQAVGGVFRQRGARGGGAAGVKGKGRKIGAARAFVVLLGRSVRETLRNTFVNGVRMAATVMPKP